MPGHIPRLMNGASHGTEAHHVMSVMCWCIVLLEDKHVPSNDTDHWHQLLHQQHLSVILPVDFSVRFNENELGINEFQYDSRDLTDLLNVGCMHSRWLTLMSHCLVATGAYPRS